jgi:hypothetical protein
MFSKANPELMLFLAGFQAGLQLSGVKTVSGEDAWKLSGYSRAYFYAHIWPHLPKVESPGTGQRGKPKVHIRVVDLDFWINEHIVYPKKLTLGRKAS